MSSTSCRIVLCALLVGGPVLADPPADAPYAITLKKGQPAPTDGSFLTPQQAVALAAKCKEAENRPPPGAVPVDNVTPAIVVGLIGLALGALAGVALAGKL